MERENWGAYIHIPFCKQKCAYCDFPSFAGKESLMEEYINALDAEISRSDRYFPHPPATLYIGGGTPTFLPYKLLAKLLNSVAKNFGGTGEQEWTVEANPGTVTFEKLKLLREHGVNRLSVGVQSFDDRILRRLSRIHRAKEALETVELAKKTGFTNVSIDLMYALPGQNFGQLRNSVETALGLGIEHISVYGLQIEKGTPFEKMYAEGTIDLPSEDETEEMYDYLTEALPQAGFMRYEISNYGLPGFESRHNLGYWQDTPYRGFGAAAHSYIGGKRLANRTDVQGYIESISRGEDPAVPEGDAQPTKKTAMGDFAFLALRTAVGINEEKFRHKFGEDIFKVFGDKIKLRINQGLLEKAGKHLRLTNLGMKYGNMVFGDFV